MSNNTSRPLMGATVASNPETTLATSPQLSALDTQDPAITGNPQLSDPSAPTHDWEKRYKDLQSFHTKSMTAKDTELSEARSHNQPNSFQVPKTAEELSAFQEKNPETFQFIQTIAHDMAAKQLEPIQGQLQNAAEQLETERLSKAEATLMARHPDFVQIDSSPQWSEWLAVQPTHIQSLIYDNPDDASKISTVLDLFKGSTGWGANAGNTSAAETQANLAAQAAQAVNTGSTSTGEGPSSGDPRASNPQYKWTEAEIGKLHPSEYAKYADAIDLAMSEGRIQMGQ